MEHENIVYQAKVIEEHGGIRLKPLPVKGGMQIEMSLHLLLEVGRALGFFGFSMNDDPHGAFPDSSEVLKGHERLPWVLLGPARNADDETASCSSSTLIITC